MMFYAVVFAALAALCSSSPLPPGGAFEFNGAPSFAQGAWFANVPEPVILMTTDIGEQVSMRYVNDFVITNMQTYTFECIDDDTFRAIISTRSLPSNDMTTRCALIFINETTRLYTSDTESCPDEFGASPQADSVNVDTAVYRREDGVLPMPEQLVCENVTTAPTIPRDIFIPAAVEAKLSPLPNKAPSGIHNGVFKGPGNINIMGVPGAAFAYVTNGSINVAVKSDEVYECKDDTSALTSFIYDTYLTRDSTAPGIPGEACEALNWVNTTTLVTVTKYGECPIKDSEGSETIETLVQPLTAEEPKCIREPRGGPLAEVPAGGNAAGESMPMPMLPGISKLEEVAKSSSIGIMGASLAALIPVAIVAVGGF